MNSSNLPKLGLITIFLLLSIGLNVPIVRGFRSYQAHANNYDPSLRFPSIFPTRFLTFFPTWSHRPTVTPSPTPTPSPTAIPTPTSSPTPTLTPTPSPNPIPHGLKGFSVNTSNKNGPQMSRGFLDPYDPDLAATQTFSIKLKDTQPIQSASVIFKTDNKTRIIPLDLVEGTYLDGRWQGVWVIDDSYLFTYHAIIEANSSNGTSSVDITLR